MIVVLSAFMLKIFKFPEAETIFALTFLKIILLC